MNTNHLRQIARMHPAQFEICWDTLDANPEHRREFASIVAAATSQIPTLESMYIALANGKSDVVQPATHTEMESYRADVRDSLINAYQLEALWDQYTKIEEIVGA